MNTRALLGTGLFATALALPLTAAADITIALGVHTGKASSDEVTFDPGVTQAWAHGGGEPGDQPFLEFHTGVPACTPIICGPAPSLGGGNATARADATRMNLGVRTHGIAGEVTGERFPAGGFGEIEIRDTLLVATPIPLPPVPSFLATLDFEVRLDLALDASLNSDSSFTFGIQLSNGSDTYSVFELIATVDGGSRTAQVLLDNGTTVQLLNDIPSIFEQSISATVSPGPLDILMFARGTANAVVSDNPSGESALVDAFNSAWVGIKGDYSSANGYSYPGFAAAAIPEPAQTALLLAGLGLVALRCRRVARH